MGRRSRRTTGGLLAVCAVCLALAPVGKAAEHPAATNATAFSACDAPTRERLSDLEDRLEADRSYATWWTRGWLGVYSVGLVHQSALAATEDDEGKRVNAVTNAVKSAIGVARLGLWPPSARLGAAPLRDELPLETESDCRRALSGGEALLRRNARQAMRHARWPSHLFNVAINLAGALVVAEAYGESARAALSGGLGVVIGTIMLWTYPSRARDDLVEYERRFAKEGAARGPGWSVGFFVRRDGIAVRIAF